MKPYNINEISEIISATVLGNPSDTIREIYFDSRTIYQPKNGLFFSLDSSAKNIEDAYQKGIRNFVSTDAEKIYDDAVFLLVANPLKALQEWAIFHRNQFHLPVIGITGSNGKTVVKEWINQLLWKDFTIVRSPKSYNSQLGVPLSVLQIQKNHNLGIFEAGISKDQEMEILEKIIQPTIGVLTHIGNAHLENFKSQKELIAEKIKLFTKCEKVIYNSDNEEVHEIIQNLENPKFITFGTKESDTIKILSQKEISTGKEIEIKCQSNRFTFQIPFQDAASVENSLTVLATLHALHLDIISYVSETKNLHPIEMRLEIKEALRDSVVINDSFNSDLHSVKVALDVLAQQPYARKSLVLTDILQTNLNKNELYQQTADLVNSHKVNDLILIGTEISAYHKLFHPKPRVYPSTDEFLKTLSLQPVQDEAILLKGARSFQLEKISALLEKKSHDTLLEINLKALIDNVKFFKDQLKPTTKMMGMIKANGYGAGSFEIAQTLQHQGIDYLGVAYADEGAELRKAGITTPMLVMNPEQSSYSTLIDYNLEPELYSFRVLDLFTQKLKEKSITEIYPIHLKIDTGMNRLGFRQEEIPELIQKLKQEKTIKIESIFTHLSTADIPEEKDFAQKQLGIFDQVYEELTTELHIKPLKHALNSAGIIHFPEHQYDMVRLGIGMFGISENPMVQKKLNHVATFKTVISRISTIEKGESVSYGRRFKAKQQMKIATLPVGYADGIRRSLGNGIGQVSIHEKLTPILGSVCMDMLMVNVTQIDCKEGDEVIIFGEQPTIQDIAEKLQTIPYEILTSISARVKRVYYRE